MIICQRPANLDDLLQKAGASNNSNNSKRQTDGRTDGLCHFCCIRQGFLRLSSVWHKMINNIKSKICPFSGIQHSRVYTFLVNFHGDLKSNFNFYAVISFVLWKCLSHCLVKGVMVLRMYWTAGGGYQTCNIGVRGFSLRTWVQRS